MTGGDDSGNEGKLGNGEKRDPEGEETTRVKKPIFFSIPPPPLIRHDGIIRLQKSGRKQQVETTKQLNPNFRTALFVPP